MFSFLWSCMVIAFKGAIGSFVWSLVIFMALIIFGFISMLFGADINWNFLKFWRK